MNKEEIYREVYRGLVIRIYRDDEAETPKEWCDDALIMLGFDHRNFWVEYQGFTKSMIESVFRGCKHEDGSVDDEAKEIKKNYHIFPVRAYIHSGVSLSLSNEKYPYNDMWDSSWVGVVLASRIEFKTTKEAKKSAQSLVEDWNNALSGNIYGYEIGDNLASSHGYYGDYDTNGIITDARERVDEWLAEQKERNGIDCPLCKVYIPYKLTNEGIHTWSCTECPFYGIEKY